MKFNEQEARDALRYGHYLTDTDIQDINRNWIRIRLIELDGVLYHHVMKNGEIITFEKIKNNA